MAGVYRAKEAFAYTDHNGVPRVVKAGDLFHGNDPCVVKRPSLFEPAEAAVSARSTETASAAPGEMRSVRKGAPRKSPGPKMSEPTPDE